MIDLATKKILVTGGSGFLGSHVVNGLLRRGVPKENIFIPSSKELDLRKWESCLRVVKGQEIIFDLAAVTGDLLLRTKIPGTLFYDNLIMGVQLIEAARQAGVQKIITIGSAAAYPENAPTPLKEEDLWMGPQSFINISYGLAKKMLLVQGQAYRHQYGADIIHLMPTNTYGPRERVASGYLMPSLIQKVIDAKKNGSKFIDAWGTGDPVRDFLYVDDTVQGILLAAEQYDESDPVNLGTGVGISIRDLVALICKFVGFTGEVHWDAAKPNGQMYRIMDTRRAEERFGFKAKVPLAEGLKKTIEWHEKQT
jgi:GDP-L-fucose synthase